MSDKLQPLVNGVKDNKRHWLELATARCLIPQNQQAIINSTNNNTSNSNKNILNDQQQQNQLLLAKSIDIDNNELGDGDLSSTQNQKALEDH